MCCTTMLSMWLSNPSPTAMVMPIVEAVLQELINAEEEQLAAGTEEAELMGTVHWGPISPLLLPPAWCPSSLEPLGHASSHNPSYP